MFELILLLALSILTARILEKRYKVASAFHAVLFIVQASLFLLTTNLPAIRNLMIDWMGKDNYKYVLELFTTPSLIIQGGISVVVLLDLSIFVFLPLLSIVALVKEIKEQFKELKVKTNIKLFFKSLITLVLDPNKDFKHTENETYLILGKLLN